MPTLGVETSKRYQNEAPGINDRNCAV